VHWLRSHACICMVLWVMAPAAALALNKPNKICYWEKEGAGGIAALQANQKP